MELGDLRAFFGFSDEVDSVISYGILPLVGLDVAK